ncbi:transcriptional regulator [Nocardioides sp. NPDC057772]|uniref:transcriptional regulator n=1 Tax=Nocardioides sp. NPDC057772 TaxID=3346245 RepID=UPI00366AC07D
MRIRPAGRLGLLPAIGLGLTLALTACGGSEESASDTEASAPAAAESSDPASEAAAPAGAEKEVKIGQTLKDPDMGDTIEVISAVRDFPSKESADVIADGGEIVLLQVKIKPGQEYGGRISDGNFQISWDNGADFWTPDTSQLEEELTAAKRTPFDDISRRDGGEVTGWIAFEADEKADTYLIEYSRAGAKVIGSDKEIAEFKKQIEIPAS